jgi:hypothetical protein
MKNSANKTTQSDPGSSAAMTVGTQAVQKKAVGVIQNMETTEPNAEHEVGLIQRKENKTGMPDQLKSGVESLSGMSMDHVKVHYNSSQPAQLNALAYAQGSDIHIGPGQEKHLPHEAWHVVQQAQGRVQATTQMKAAVPVNDDPGLEHEADVMGEKAMQMKSGPLSYIPANGQNSSLSSTVFQMKPREALVDWAVTHLVQEQNDSLFGKDDEDGWKAGELPVELGELKKGQLIIVDDAIVFMSRRGSNQENAEKRALDSVKELKHQWYPVLAVGKANYDGKKVYIRSETIKLAEEKEKEKEDIRAAEIPEKEAIGETVTKRLAEITQTWSDESRKRRRSIGQVKYKDDPDKLPEGLSSGWNWDQYDEGEDVATALTEPESRSYDGSSLEKQTVFTLKAYYQKDEYAVPIAFLILEENKNAERSFNKYKAPEPQFFYIRWLIGDPVKKGGGSAVMDAAKQKSFDSQQAIYVEVAYSAVSWYQKMKFEVVVPGKFTKGEGYGDTLLKYVPPKPKE